MSQAADPLAAFVARSLDGPAPADVRRLAEAIAARPGIAAVLFYGARLRNPGAGGLADLYVLTDSDGAWSGPGLAALGSRLLPPNVYHLRLPAIPSPGPAGGAPRPALSSFGGIERHAHTASSSSGLTGRSPSAPEHFPAEPEHDGGNPGDVPAERGHDGDEPGDARLRAEHDELGTPAIAAKVAVMRLSAFRQRMSRDSPDTTLWARFAQPAALLHARDEAARTAVVAAVSEGWRTAAWWADRLAEGDRWAGLFAATYGAELRPEGTGRPGAIAAGAPELYAEIDRLLPRRRPEAAEIAAARSAWVRRRRAGRALNAARLIKAAFTFRGGAAYALDKIERHAGPAALSPWERRLPWLAAPVVLLRLLRRGGLR